MIYLCIIFGRTFKTMGYFPTLSDEANELYEKLKNHKEYHNIIRKIEVDLCFAALNEDLGESWVFSHARPENLTYDYLAKTGVSNAEFYILRQIGYHQNQLLHWGEQLNLLYKHWKDLIDQYENHNASNDL